VKDVGLDPPSVSVVVIAHNESVGGPEAVRSILAQDALESLELVFVDDGSTDGTGAIVFAAAAGDPRFRLITLPENRGRGAARAAGLAAARGHHVAFVDADVSIPSDWLRRCLAELPGHAAVGGIAVPDGHTAVLARLTGARPRELGGSMPITGANVLFEGATVREFGFDAADRLGEDFRLASKLLSSGHSLKRVPGLIARHEEHKSYRQELVWRFENGLDAARHFTTKRLRFADLVWLLWLGAWTLSAVLLPFVGPVSVLLGLVVSVLAGVAHTTTRFHATPAVPFAAACLGNIPLMNAYLLGRAIGVGGGAHQWKP
jgi:glycosyltransferase involved in cell wall biosynthesis